MTKLLMISYVRLGASSDIGKRHGKVQYLTCDASLSTDPWLALEIVEDLKAALQSLRLLKKLYPMKSGYNQPRKRSLPTSLEGSLLPNQKLVVNYIACPLVPRLTYGSNCVTVRPSGPRYALLQNGGCQTIHASVDRDLTSNDFTATLR
jgi:hypothetical protein